MRNDLPEIKQALKDRIEDLCRRLLPDGNRVGRFWISHNPVTGDYSQSPEFKVPLDRDKGAWIDWRTGEKGDVIGLVQYLTGGDFKAAMDFAREFLGLRSMSPEQRRDMARRAEDARRNAEKTEQERRLKRMGQAEKLWNSGYQDGSNSTAEALARAYFSARQIPLNAIPNRDLQTFRYAHAQEYWARAQFRHENGRRVKVQDGPKYPAVLSAMRLPSGQISAVHMTFLSPLGPQKLETAKGESAKIMFGEAFGAVIRISHGPEGEPPETACQAHPVLIGEGIETTASVSIGAPEARAWACGSLAGMMRAPIWLPCVSAVIILKDHFKHKTTEKQYGDMMRELATHGKPLVEMESHIGNDFNDLMKGDE